MKKMTLKVYLEQLVAAAKANPKLMGLPVITAKDDEGNGYNYVFYTPGQGVVFDGYDIEDTGEVNQPANAVLLN